ncbi:MAG: nitrite/sulfite reductase [Myxococcales bacterium]|nr:MAG: nitrite/sulfite reductase [Myxococcales bacterium]
MTELSWKSRLAASIPKDMAEEIDVFETQIELRKQGKIEEKLFAEARLRRGVYGQRYDNGKRHNGESSQAINFPCGELTKGPDTVWDAPGMERIKIPYGRLTNDQLDVLAEVAEEYSDAILHVTTRQDIQLHFVHIEDTPDMMRRLAVVGITTREACGNSVRNITACPYAGVCNTESFDVRSYANALTRFLLGHPDVQDFGRKFKIAFSGCKDHACGLVNIHDLGVVAKKRIVNGNEERGFEFYVGGGLGSVPQHAKLFDEFLPEKELLPMTQAVCRVFARLGEKNNRARARIKFLISKLGIDEFRKLVLEERKTIPADPRWHALLEDKHTLDGVGLYEEKPLRPGKVLVDGNFSDAFKRWRATNIRKQAQDGYVVATVRLPLGDFTSDQARVLADLARRHTGDTWCTTVEQNLALRWLPEADLPEFFEALQKVGLDAAGASSIEDVTSCPGTDTCKLGISASRGLAAALSKHINDRIARAELKDPVKDLRIKCSGCFNSCGQHHIADLGFLGVSRNVKGRRVPHFQVVLGGQWANNGGSYGLAIGAVPAKSIPKTVDLLTDTYLAEREGDENFQAWISRKGKTEIRGLLKELMIVPEYDHDRSYYTDWGDPREYTIGDIGVGECAGEIVPLAMFGLAASERQVFEAQVELDKGNHQLSLEKSFRAMLDAAKALVQIENIDITDEPEHILSEFRTRFHDTGLFNDPYAGAKFANYLFAAEKRHKTSANQELAHQSVEEAQLFIEAAHACYDRISQNQAGQYRGN